MQTLKSSKKIHQNASFPAKIFQRRGSAGPQSPVEGTASPLDLSPSGALIRYRGSVQNYGWVSRARRGHWQLTRLQCVFTWSIPSIYRHQNKLFVRQLHPHSLNNRRNLYVGLWSPAAYHIVLPCVQDELYAWKSMLPLTNLEAGGRSSQGLLNRIIRKCHNDVNLQLMLRRN